MAGVAGALLAWAVAVRLQKHPIIPGPIVTMRGMVEIAKDGRLFRYAVASLFRVTWGFVPAVFLGTAVGLLLGWHRRSELAFGPYIQLLRPISPLAWIPLAILWFGVGDVPAVFIIFLASFLALVVTAMNAVHNVSSVHVNVARNFGLSTTEILWRIVLPSVMPQILLGLRLALGIAWLVVVAAEMLAVNSGLGFLVIDSRNAGPRYDLVIAGMISIGVIGLLLDRGLARLHVATSGVGPAASPQVQRHVERRARVRAG